MKRLFAPIDPQELEGWNKCLDSTRSDRNANLKSVVAMLNGKGYIGQHKFARGWLDAYETFKDEQNTRMYTEDDQRREAISNEKN